MTTERLLFDSKNVIYRRSRRRMVIAGAAAGSCLAPATIGALLPLQEVGALSLPAAIRGYLTLAAVGALLGAVVMGRTFPQELNAGESTERVFFVGSSLRFVMCTVAAGAVFIASLPLVLGGSLPPAGVLVAACIFGPVVGLLPGVLHWPAIRHAELSSTRFAHDLLGRVSFSALILLATTIAFGLLCAALMGPFYLELVCSGRIDFGSWDPQGTCPQAHLVWTRFPLAVAVPTLTAVWLGLLAAHERRISNHLVQALRRNEHSSLVLGPSIPISSPELAEVLPLRASDLLASHVLTVHSRLDTDPYRTNPNPPLAFIASESDPSKS